MRIPEKARIKKGLEMIEEMSSNMTDSTLAEIYRIAHSLRNQDCRVNHPEWLKKLEPPLYDQGEGGVRVTREQKSARMILSGFNMAYDHVKRHTHTGNQISELLGWLETRRKILEEKAGINTDHPAPPRAEGERNKR